MKRFCNDLLFCILFQMFAVFPFEEPRILAQENVTDSLLSIVKSAKEDTIQINALHLLIKQFINDGNYDKALFYAKQEIKQAEKLNYQKGLAAAYNSIGVIHWYQGRYERAAVCHQKSLEIQNRIGNKKGVADSYSNIGNVYVSQGNYEKALEYYLKSLKIREQIEDKQGTALSYVNIGGVYNSYGNYKKALQNCIKASKIQEEIGDKYGLAISYSNIGVFYFSQGDFEKSLEYHLNALKINEALGNKQGVASSHMHVGIAYERQGGYDKALDSQFKSLNISEEVGDKQGIGLSYSNIGSIYMKKGEVLMSEHYLELSLSIFKEIGYKDGIKEIYYLLSELYSKTGKFKQAYAYQKLYSDIKDTLLNEKSGKQIAEMSTKYETEKKEKQNVMLSQKNQIQKMEIEKEREKRYNQFIILICFTIFAAAIFFVLYFRSKYRHKEVLKTELLKQQQLQTQAIIETQEEMRRLIARDLHDGIGHKLTTIKINFGRLVEGENVISPDRKLISEQIEHSLDEAHKEVRLLSHSMMPRALQESEFEDAFSDLVEQTLSNSGIKYSLKNELKTGLPKNIQICLYRVLQELLNNIIKHAKASDVAVQIYRNKNIILMFVEDNGRGIQHQDSTDSNGGIGLSNIAGRINALNGFFTIERPSDKGTLAIVRIPLPNSENR